MLEQESHAQEEDFVAKVVPELELIDQKVRIKMLVKTVRTQAIVTD